MSDLIDARLNALEAQLCAQQLRLRVIERHLQELRRETVVASPKAIVKAAVNG